MEKNLLRRCFGISAIVLFAMSRTLFADAGVDAKAKDLWQQIKFSNSQNKFYWKYWREIRQICRRPFLDLIQQEGKMQENTSFYIQQFGKTGATDIRWTLAARTIALPTTDRWRPSPNGDPFTNHRLFFCECLVKRLMNEPKVLRRYYRLVVWRGSFFGIPDDPNAASALRNSVAGAKEAPDGCWWYARDFVLLAHSVGRDDLIRDLDSTNLLPRLKQFERWISNNKKSLVFSESTFYWERKVREEEVMHNKPTWPAISRVPRTPFPEWERLPLFLRRDTFAKD